MTVEEQIQKLLEIQKETIEMVKIQKNMIDALHAYIMKRDGAVDDMLFKLIKGTKK